MRRRLTMTPQIVAFSEIRRKRARHRKATASEKGALDRQERGGEHAAVGRREYSVLSHTACPEKSRRIIYNRRATDRDRLATDASRGSNRPTERGSGECSSLIENDRRDIVVTVKCDTLVKSKPLSPAYGALSRPVKEEKAQNHRSPFYGQLW